MPRGSSSPRALSMSTSLDLIDSELTQVRALMHASPHHANTAEMQTLINKLLDQRIQMAQEETERSASPSHSTGIV